MTSLTHFMIKFSVKKPDPRPAQNGKLAQSTRHTFRVKRDQAVTERPLFHWIIEYDVLRKDDHGDVLKFTQTLQDLSHGFGL